MNVLLITFIAFLVLSFLIFFIKDDNKVRLYSVIISTLFSLFGLLSVFLIIGQKYYSNISFNFYIFNNYELYFRRIYPYSLFFLFLIFIINIAISIYSFSYMKNKNNLKSFFFYYLTLIISMIGVVLSREFISFIIWWELMALSSFLLVIRDYEKEDVIKAGRIYFIANLAGSLFIISAFSIVSFNSKLSFIDVSNLTLIEKNLALLLAFLGFGLKSGFIPLHVWLPFAHPASPSNISALMSGVMIKMGIYGIIFFSVVLDVDLSFLGEITLLVGCVSAVLGVIYAISQHNLKKLLAYHSIENIGIILMGLGLWMISKNINRLASFVALFGAMLHILNHALFKSLLFISAGYIIKQTNNDNIDELAGLIKYFPKTSYSFLGGSIAISGIPPFNGFVSEFLIYLSSFLLIKSFPIESLLVIISLSAAGGLALFCFSKVFGTAFLGNPKQGFNGLVEDKYAVFSMYFLLFVCLVIGVFPQIIFYLFFERFDMYSTKYVLSLLNFVSAFYIVLFSLFIFFVYFKKYLYRGKKILNTLTWDCGYNSISNPERFQYSSSSFAQLATTFFSRILTIDVVFKYDGKFILNNTYFETHPKPVFFEKLYLPLSKKIYTISKKYSVIQSGNMRVYMLYIFLSLLFLILWKM